MDSDTPCTIQNLPIPDTMIMCAIGGLIALGAFLFLYAAYCGLQYAAEEISHVRELRIRELQRRLDGKAQD